MSEGGTNDIMDPFLSLVPPFRFEYSFYKPEVKDEVHTEAVQVAINTFYKASAAMFENFIDEVGMAVEEAAAILPRGVEFRLENGSDEEVNGQKKFIFEKTT